MWRGRRSSLKSVLAGDSINTFAVATPWRATHLRFHIYPDGGVARLRVHGDVLPSARWMGRAGAEVDLASVEHGGAVVAASDMFFGSRHNLVMPGRSVNMGDGWETKRSRREGFDWAVVRLAAEGVVSRIEIDTNHFKGERPRERVDRGVRRRRLPRACQRHGSRSSGGTKLQPHTRHFFEIAAEAKATHARLRIWPDGGVSRLRSFGAVTLNGRTRFGLRRLDALTVDEAERELLACCGSGAWAKATAARRPFASLASLTAAGDAAWRALAAADQLEAFHAHPRIGERHAAADTGATSRAWAEGEQSHMASAEQATRDALATETRGIRGEVRSCLPDLRDGQERRRDARGAPRAHGERSRRRVGHCGRGAEEDHATSAGEDGDAMITTHVLDVARGKPASGVSITLEHRDAAGAWRETGRGATDADGRLKTLTATGALATGQYRITFDTGAYFAAAGVDSFYPSASVVFIVADGGAHYHVPLLLSPFGYSTYRGS